MEDNFEINEYLSKKLFENAHKLYHSFFIKPKNYIYSSIYIDTINYSGNLNIIIDIREDLVDSKIISIPTDFDQTMFSGLEQYTLTIVYLNSKNADIVYNDINNYYRNFNFKTFTMSFQDYAILHMVLNTTIINTYTPQEVISTRLTLKSEFDFGDHAIYILPKAVSAFFNKEKYDFGELLLMIGWKKLD
jgi:hypothetical protein